MNNDDIARRKFDLLMQAVEQAGQQDATKPSSPTAKKPNSPPEHLLLPPSAFKFRF